MGRVAEHDSRVSVREPGSRVVAGDEDRAPGIEGVVLPYEAEGADPPLHRLIEALRPERAEPVRTQDPERRQRPGLVAGLAERLHRPQRRCEPLVRELRREPLEAVGIGQGTELGGVVGRVPERRHHGGCIAAHHGGGEASNPARLVETPVAHKLDHTRRERRRCRHRCTTGLGPSHSDAGLGLGPSASPFDLGHSKCGFSRGRGFSPLGAGSGPAQIREHCARLNRCELRRIAEHHEPGTVRERGEHPRHEGEVHHRSLVEDERVDREATPLIPARAGEAIGAPSSPALRILRGPAPTTPTPGAARAPPPGGGRPPCRSERRARSGRARRARAR